jgi:hypothetical protein
MATDVMKIQRWKQTIPTQLMIMRPVRAVEKIEQTIVLNHVAIGIDNLVIHHFSRCRQTFSVLTCPTI